MQDVSGEIERSYQNNTTDLPGNQVRESTRRGSLYAINQNGFGAHTHKVGTDLELDHLENRARGLQLPLVIDSTTQDAHMEPGEPLVLSKLLSRIMKDIYY